MASNSNEVEETESLECVEEEKTTTNDEIVQKTTEIRILSDEELKKLQIDSNKYLANFKKEKISKEAKKSWDFFYRRNETRFFKDRHWTLREFNELDERFCKNNNNIDTTIRLLEIGCGVGNFIFPLLKINEKLHAYVCDFSDKAIELLQKTDNYNLLQQRCFPFVCDVTQPDSLDSYLNGIQVDIVALIFVLSAIQPSKMSDAIKNIYKVMKPGGIVLFRDYGLYDHAMIRFNQTHKYEDKCYVRCDNTLSYFLN